MFAHLQVHMQMENHYSYTSCCNTAKGIYYYTTYDNHQITAVDMHAENLDSDQLICYPLLSKGEVRWQNK